MSYLGSLGEVASSTTSEKTVTITVQAGDLIVVRAGGSSSNGPLNVSSTGVAVTWTTTAATASSYSPIYLYTAKVSTAGTLAIKVTRSSGSSYFWMEVSGWGGADVAGTPVTGTGSGTPTRQVTTTSANSGIAWISSDYNSGSTSGRQWASIDGQPPTELYAEKPSSTFYAADYADAGAVGAKVAGLSYHPLTQKWQAIAVEIKANLAPPPPPPDGQPHPITPVPPGASAILGDVLTPAGEAIAPAPTEEPDPDPYGLLGTRLPTFRFTEVTRAGVTVGKLDSVRAAGRLQLSQQATIRASGNLERSVADGAIPNHIKVEYVLDEGRETERAWPLAVLLSASPVSKYGTPNTSQVEVYDRTTILAEDAIEAPLFFPAGTNITDEVRRQITKSGGITMAITPSTKALSASMAFEPGDSRLKVVNALLAAADYFGVWCDGNGVFRAEPYREPAERGIAWTFRAGEDSVVSPEWDLDDDTYAVPNKVIAIQRTDGQTAPAVAFATITDPTSPWHFDNMGFWRSEVMRDVEAATVADLQKKVNRRLAEASRVARTVTIRHAWVPVGINDVVRFEMDGIEGTFVVINLSIPLDAQQLVTSTLKEVGV